MTRPTHFSANGLRADSDYPTSKPCTAVKNASTNGARQRQDIRLSLYSASAARRSHTSRRLGAWASATGHDRTFALPLQSGPWSGVLVRTDYSIT